MTGGEPMLFAEVVPLCAALRDQGRHVTVETAGTIYAPVACDLMSISPKLANSTPTPRESPRWAVRHEAARHAPQVVRRLLGEYDYQLKFVVERPEDCREVEAYLAGVSPGRIARGYGSCPRAATPANWPSGPAGSRRIAPRPGCNSARGGTSSGSGLGGVCELGLRHTPPGRTPAALRQSVGRPRRGGSASRPAR